MSYLLPRWCDLHTNLSTECDNAFCPDSHQPLCYDRAELAQQAGYIVYADFIHALSVVFGPKFLWKYELYIEKLYEAFGVNQQVVIRHVRTSVHTVNIGNIVRLWF